MPDGDLCTYHHRTEFQWLQHFVAALIDERHPEHGTALSGIRQWLDCNGISPDKFARAVATAGAGLIAEAEANGTDGAAR
jgi:hypothetical protein